MARGQNQIDSIDLLGIVVLPIAAGMIFGVWEFSIDVLTDLSLSDGIFEVAGSEVTYAMVLALGALAWIVATNELNQADYDQWEYGVIAFAFLSIPAYEFIPAFENLVQTHDAMALGLTFLVAIAAAYISYTE